MASKKKGVCKCRMPYPNRHEEKVDGKWKCKDNYRCVKSIGKEYDLDQGFTICVRKGRAAEIMKEEKEKYGRTYYE